MTTGNDVPEEPVLVLVGDRVALGPLRRDLIQLYHRWDQDPVVRTGLGRPVPDTLDGRLAAYEHESKSGLNAAHFTVYATTDGGGWQPVGLSSLEITLHTWVADFTIILGERRGEGLGTEATALTLDWAFNVAGLHNVTLEVWAPNKAAIRVYEKAGFQHVGVRRNAARWLGRQCDMVIMDAVPADLTRSVVME